MNDVNDLKNMTTIKGKKKLKIAIDWDGTLWAHKRFFREFMEAMQAAGHQVGILTGHRERSRERDLQKMRDVGFPEPDFYLGNSNEVEPLPHGPVMKSKAIKDHGIDYYFDDFDFNEDRALPAYEEGGVLPLVFKVHNLGKG